MSTKARETRKKPLRVGWFALGRHAADDFDAGWLGVYVRDEFRVWQWEDAVEGLVW